MKSEPSKESPEDMNYTKFRKELPPAANAKQMQEITSIRLKAKKIPKSHGCILLPLFELKLPSAILEKWELELADTPDDEIDIELFFKFLNRQVVSKEAGERNLQGNLSLKGRSTNKGRDERRYPPALK